MELTVKIIDINYGSRNEVLQKSPALGGYAYLIDCIRQNTSAGTSRDKAIKAAVNHCIEKGVLAEFLEKHFREMCDMFDYGITYEEELEVKEEEGREKGFLEAALKLLQKGTSLEDVIRILDLSDSQINELRSRVA